MSVVIYGTRAYGRVHAHGGEYAETLFAHLDFVPIVPLRSQWISADLGGGERVGFPIRLHLRSVAAAYLRVWAPAVAAAAYIGLAGAGGLALAAALLAASAWSWTWRSQRGDAAARGDFDRVALGSRCDPAWMKADLRAQIARALERQLAARPDARPPDDVAALGARDADEAITAYGLLRLASVHHHAARAAADRLRTSAAQPLPTDDGPYRARLATGVPGLADTLARTASARAAQAQARATAAQAARKPRWFQRPGVQLVGLCWLTLTVPAMVAAARSPATLDAPVRVGHAELDASRPSTRDRVAVRCDRVERQPHLRAPGKRPVAWCWIGSRLLPVVGPIASASGDVIGRLARIPEARGDGSRWYAQLQRDPNLDARTFAVYLRTADDAGAEIDVRIARVVAAAFLVATIVGWARWIAAFRRRRRAR
jgi:hypothetical protein